MYECRPAIMVALFAQFCLRVVCFYRTTWGMDDIRSLIDAAGGQHKAARLIGVPVTTIHAWVKKNRVPAWRDDKIAELRAAVSQAAA